MSEHSGQEDAGECTEGAVVYVSMAGRRISLRRSGGSICEHGRQR
jgi:hypothetical protein